MLRVQRRMLKDARDRTWFYVYGALLGIVIAALGRRSIEYAISSQRLLTETLKLVNILQNRLPDLHDIALPEPPLILPTTTVHALWSVSLACCLAYQVGHLVAQSIPRSVMLGRIPPRDQSREGWVHLDRGIRVYIWVVAAVLPFLLLAALFLFLSGFIVLLFAQGYQIPGALMTFMCGGVILPLTYGIIFQTYMLQHPLSYDLHVPPDPAYQGDPKDKEDAMVLYSSLRKGAFKHLSKCSGDHVVNVVRRMLSRLLHRPVPSLNESFPDFWHTSLEGRAAIARILIGRFNHELAIWESLSPSSSSSSSPEFSPCWEPWMEEALACIDAILASAPGAMQFELLPSPVILGSGVVLVSLLTQNVEIAKRVLLLLTARRISTLQHYHISRTQQVHRTNALSCLRTAYQQLESDRSVDSTLGEIKNTMSIIDTWLQYPTVDVFLR